LEQDTLQKLIQNCKAQHSKSQEELYRMFFGYAMRICLRYSGTYEDAIEILNDGFLRVFTKLDLYNPELSFGGWLRKIMINTALNRYKRQKRLNQFEQINVVSHQKAEADDISQQIDYDEIANFIQKLSPVYRTVFNLFVIDGYKHEEIAEMLNISVGASKSNLSKARANLREMLKKKEQIEYARLER
jgi:RNA polymerase sigma-70 factor (ECF subfamily)